LTYTFFAKTELWFNPYAKKNTWQACDSHSGKSGNDRRNTYGEWRKIWKGTKMGHLV